MADYIESTNWFSRLGQSITGVLFGLLLMVIAVPLLWWNEGRAVHMEQSLKEGASHVRTVSADKPDPSNNGKLVHMSGTATTDETLKDEEFGVNAKALALNTKFEMYQWKEEDKGTETSIGGTTHHKYGYTKAWSATHIDSKSFKSQDGHENPAEMPQSRHKVAQSVALGGFSLDDGLKNQIEADDTVTITKDMLPSDKKDWRVVDGKAWSGNPQDPRVGDLRVSFAQAKPGQYSLVAVQNDNTFEPYHAKAGGNDIEMLKPGTHSADDMFKAALENNAMMTWILRFVGWLVMFIGLCMIFSPIQTFGSVIPFVGDILGMGTGLFAFAIASTLSLMVVAVAWVAYRPLLGVGLLAVAGGLFFFMKHHGGKKAAAAA